jgi:hypothetical protein
MRANKTDSNYADGLAHLVSAGYYKDVDSRLYLK